MSTRAQLATTTSNVVPMAPLVAMKLPEPNIIKSHAIQAWKDNKQGGLLLGTAEQRITFAVMCEAEVIARTTGTNYGLADCLTIPEAKKFYVDRLLEFFSLSTAPDTTQLGDDLANAATAEYDRRVKMVKRGVHIGAVLRSKGVVFSMFDLKLQAWNVFSSMVLAKNASPTGRIAIDLTIPLDGRSFTYNMKAKKGGDKSFNGSANMKTMLSICEPEKAARKPKAKVTSGATFKLESPRDVSQHVAFPVLVAALHLLFVKGGSKDSWRKDDYPAAWSCMTAIQQHFDEVRKRSEWSLPRDADADKLAAHKAERAALAKSRKAAADKARADKAAKATATRVDVATPPLPTPAA